LYPHPQNLSAKVIIILQTSANNANYYWVPVPFLSVPSLSFLSCPFPLCPVPFLRILSALLRLRYYTAPLEQRASPW
jgi:hypothetical protein